MKKKTVATLNVNRDGFAIGDFNSFYKEEPIQVKTGAWIAHMHYEDNGFGWQPTEMVITAATALLFPRLKWEEAPHDVYSESSKIAVWDWQSAQKLGKDEDYYKNWVAKTEEILGKRDYAEFHNFMLFQDNDPNDTDYHFYPMQLCRGSHGDVLGIKIILKHSKQEEVK